MIRRLLFKLSGRLPCRLIDIEGRPYLERYYLGRVRGVTFYLHRFVQGDGDRNVHDHPWDWSLGWVLAGGYDEERLTGFDPGSGWQHKRRRVRWWRPNFIGRRTFHRIADPRPETWTLFIHGRKTKGWGFLAQAHDLGTGGSAVIYRQPYDVARTRAWWTRAEPGARAGRAAFRASRRSGVLASGGESADKEVTPCERQTAA